MFKFVLEEKKKVLLLLNTSLEGVSSLGDSLETQELTVDV